MPHRPDHAIQSAPAPETPRAARAFQQAVSLYHQGIFSLDGLDRQIGGVGDADLHAVLAVPARPAAGPAAERFEIEVAFARPGVDAREDGGGVGAVAGRRRAVGHGRRERAEHDVDDPLAGMRPRRHRGGEDGVEQRALRRGNLHAVDHGLVVRHFGIQQRLERVGDRSDGRVHGHIDVARHLRRGAGEIEARAFALLLDGQHDGDVAGVDAVIVHDIVEAVSAVRDGADSVRHTGCGAGQHVFKGSQHGFGPVGRNGLRHAPHAQIAGRNLREVVPAPFVRQPHIQQHEIEQLALQFAPAEQLDHRHAQAFLVDFRHAAGHRPRRHAADIGMVGDIADPGDDAPVREHRGGHVDVGQVRAARGVRIVGDDDVAFLDIVAIARQQAVHQPAHGRYVDRQRLFRLRNQTAPCIHDRGRVVVPLLDVGRIGALHQCGEGFVGDRAERVGQDFEADGVEGGHATIRMVRLPWASTAALSPG